MAMRSRTGGMSPSEVSVRAVAGAAERAEWDRLMDEHHCLGFRCLFGGVRHVSDNGRTLAGARGLAVRSVSWRRCGRFAARPPGAWRRH